MYAYNVCYKKYNLFTIGIALDKGQIGSVDDKVLDYFPDYKVKRGEKTIYNITIKHLLTIYINSEKSIVIAVSSYFKPTILDRVDFIQENIEPFISAI